MPQLLAAAENETLTKLAADITTYADTCIPKFIMGDMDIDTEWDSYIETLNSMGIEECIKLDDHSVFKSGAPR